MSRTYVALLYSIVLTPQKRVVMADLRAMAEGLGYENVRTLVSSGNLVFDARDTAIADLENRLEAAFPKTFGRHVDIIVRDAAGWLALAAANPFPEEANATPDQVAVRVMRSPVPADAEDRLRQAVSPDEKFAVVNGDPWIVFSRTAPNSRLLAAMNHKRLGIGTSRNWNTVRNLARMLSGK
ncbi:DUF1697 domain-containing protein [Mesorhizobium sp. 8]|uniref:DUF1697 domain-containing protein n=1 Tax=Mesorhizobium sp. 8 TaxID=2584466 RepID=UPI001121F686|nr:DUF1697 domain-containing protein [Mesorhizobium sp. 8]QDB99593.1 DUF1697 domain-containing protein [Mesorhizobium sp. 8]